MPAPLPIDLRVPIDLTVSLSELPETSSGRRVGVAESELRWRRGASRGADATTVRRRPPPTRRYAVGGYQVDVEEGAAGFSSHDGRVGGQQHEPLQKMKAIQNHAGVRFYV